MMGFMEINGLSYDKVHTEMEAYEGWVQHVQHVSDPNNIDVRVEPKFEIDSMTPYTGGWCRP